jgi:hypothetical protein
MDSRVDITALPEPLRLPLDSLLVSNSGNGARQ